MRELVGKRSRHWRGTNTEARHQ